MKEILSIKNNTESKFTFVLTYKKPINSKQQVLYDSKCFIQNVKKFWSYIKDLKIKYFIYFHKINGAYHIHGNIYYNKSKIAFIEALDRLWTKGFTYSKAVGVFPFKAAPKIYPIKHMQFYKEESYFKFPTYFVQQHRLKKEYENGNPVIAYFRKTGEFKRLQKNKKEILL